MIIFFFFKQQNLQNQKTALPVCSMRVKFYVSYQVLVEFY